VQERVFMWSILDIRHFKVLISSYYTYLRWS